MKTNIKGKKYIVMGIILLLFLGLNLTTTVSSLYIKDTDDGVYFNDFEDYSDIDDAFRSGNITDYKNCVLNASSIMLDQGSNIHYYDYSTEGNEHKAWESDLTLISGDEFLFKLRNLPSEYPIDNTGYDAISENDDEVLETRGLYFDVDLFDIYYTFTPIHHFSFKIDQNKSNVEEIRFAWWYGDYRSDANIDDILLYVWDYSPRFLKRWTREESKTYNSSIGTNLDGDIVFTSGNTGYTSNDGYIDFLIVAIPKKNGEACILTTDYVNLTVTSKAGYLEDGYIISTEVVKPSSGRWESIVWSSSMASDTSYVKIQVLDEHGNPLNEDKDGFTSSPADLSILPTANNTIKIKALLHSSDLLLTPRLHSWGVTWQTQGDRFQDNFSTDLRIDKAVGVNIADKKINISDFYSDWPIFGKNPANTRSYEGDGPQKSELYWKTKKETAGGWFRSPVMNNGIVYIASSADKKIYAFNATVPSSKKGKEINYRDSSNSPYIVDSSIAVGDDYAIVATSEIDKSNKIYALNKSNLKDEKWSYTYPGDESICFSSAPTVSNGKVFVTSWNGRSWDTPLLSFLYSLIGGNNKIIALNLADGTRIWDNGLPAGSFSTPAVADGMVFVGCDNLFGSSLFAFDEETGKKVWDKDVGLIGKSSPVVYNGKVFIVVKELNRLYVTGDVKVVAVDEYTGEMLWNKTLAENILVSESLPKVFQLSHLMATSTVAVSGNRLFVTSPDGTAYALNTTDGGEIWSNDELSSKVFDVIPTFTCTSPVVAYDRVYVAMANGIVYALRMSDGEKVWEFDCDTENPEFLSPSYVLASPIVADGVLYVSVTEELNTFTGGIYAIGNYTPNQRAKVVSTYIHVPRGYWWDEFNADYVNETGSTITFSILDESGDPLKSSLNGSHNKFSDINCNVIQLCAEFNRENASQNLILSSWSVTWNKEEVPPVFHEESFKPDPDGWINTNTPTCSIDVYDETPGINEASAKYKIKYKPIGKDSVIWSDWFSANCSKKDERGNWTITANINDSAISKEIGDLKNIEIYVEDLSRHSATFKLPEDFKKDTIPPNSYIENVTSFSSKYNEPVVITANANDPGDSKVNKSGVKTVALYYRLQSGENDWLKYGPDVESPYSWSFESDISGIYEFYTIAKDKAGNTEDKIRQGEINFTFDMNPPYKPVFREEYRFNELPEFSIEFEDDFELESVYYRLNFHGVNEWTKINTVDINSERYTGEWSLLQDAWDYMMEEDIAEEDYYMYFRLNDSCGNQYITPSDDEALKIIKDITASKSYLDLSDFSEFHWDNVFTISATIPDDDEDDIADMELYYRYSADNEKWDEWKQYGDNLKTPPFEWEFTPKEGSGYYEFYTKVWDTAGNMGESPMESIGVTLFPMIPLTIMIFLVIVLIIVTVSILVKAKKKKI